MAVVLLFGGLPEFSSWQVVRLVAQAPHSTGGTVVWALGGIAAADDGIYLCVIYVLSILGTAGYGGPAGCGAALLQPLAVVLGCEGCRMQRWL